MPTPGTPGRDPPAPWASPEGAPSAARALDGARPGRLVLEDFVPLEDSLEWRLGQEYYRHRGSLAFVGDPDPVPFAINNDGSQSIRAAEVFFTSLTAAEQAGGLTRDEDLFVLELGIGVGLFARYFLDWFELLCRREGKDYYDRLTYIAGDRSARMLRDAGRAGVFGNHAGRYRLRLADALCPRQGVLVDADVRARGPRPLRAVFLNYLLDCLPASVVRLEAGEFQLLHARTSLPAAADWRGLLDAGADEVRRLASSGEAWRELLPAYPLMQTEYQYRAVNPDQVPSGDFALRQAGQVPGRAVLHSHGPLRCLEALLGLLADGGVILANDYGQVKEESTDWFEHQRFSQSSAVGVNFVLLGRYFGEGERACWREPPGDEGADIHARLLMRTVNPPVAVRFAECYGDRARAWLDAPAARARELGKARRLQAALGQYREALSRHPYSWPLLIEAAQFLVFALGDAKSGLELAREALRHNPACSAHVWNVLGDCLYLVGRKRDARAAFEKALRIAGDDVRARFNLAFVHADEREYERALVLLAEGLARDRFGAYLERLLQKQGEVLALLDQTRQRRLVGQINRIAGTNQALPSGLSQQTRLRSGSDRADQVQGGTGS